MMMNEMTLTNEALKDVNGGMIVDRGLWHDYYVISDYDGAVLSEKFFHSDAWAQSQMLGVSDTIISEEQYNAWMDGKRRGDTSSPFTH